MRNANALQIVPETDPAPAGHAIRERRAPALINDLGPAPDQDGATLHWPVSWPAALYIGDTGADCTVHEFSALGAHVTMTEPPPVGARVSLKFPFTIYLLGRVAWRRGRDLGIAFDEDSRRSARIVEDVVLDRPAD